MKHDRRNTGLKRLIRQFESDFDIEENTLN